MNQRCTWCVNACLGVVGLSLAAAGPVARGGQERLAPQVQRVSAARELQRDSTETERTVDTFDRPPHEPRTSVASVPVGTAFTYQGTLEDSDGPVTNTSPGCDFTFSLWDDPNVGSGTQIGPTRHHVAPVDRGVFTVELDFGADAITEEARYLEIAACCPNGCTPEVLQPRQELMPTPLALKAIDGVPGFTVRHPGFLGDSRAHLARNLLGVEGWAAQSGVGRAGVIGISVDPGSVSGLFIQNSGVSGYSESGAGVAGITDSPNGFAGAFLGPPGSANYFEQRVGVGTENPTAILHIIEPSALGSGQAVIIEGGSDGVNPNIRFTEDNGQFVNIRLNESNGNAMELMTGSAARLTIDQSGNVGIGTDSPSGLLHVAHNLNPDVTFENNGDTSGGRGVSIDFRHSNGTGAQIHAARNSGDTDGMRIELRTQPIGGGSPTERMRIETNGDVGIGETSPDATLHVGNNGNGAVRLQVDGASSLVPVAVDRTGDGVLVSFTRSGSFAGSITVSGATVSYNAFTGAHYAWSDEPLDAGWLVSLTGKTRPTDAATDSEPQYGISASATPNDPRCAGAYLGVSDPTKPASATNPQLIAAVGNGALWVVESEGDVEPGDYLISSDVRGHAMLDDPERFAVGNVVARAAEPIDWSQVTESIDGRKHKKVSVFFESFERGAGVAAGKLLDHQRQEIDDLRERIDALEGSAAGSAAMRAGVPLLLVGLLGLAALRRRTARAAP